MLDPRLDEALVLLVRGEGRSAMLALRRLLSEEPGGGPLLQAWGVAQQHSGDDPDALAWFARASSVMAQTQAPHAAQAELLVRQAQRSRAVRPGRRAAALDPASGTLLAVLAEAEGDRDSRRAVVLLRRALAVDPGNDIARINLGIGFRRIGHLAEALCVTRASLARMPAVSEILVNFAVGAIKRNRLKEAEAWANRALAIGNAAEALWNRGVARVMAGRFVEAWPDMQARWRLTNGPRRRHGQERLLRGEPLGGRDLLLLAEQGVGDTIQFCRYAPLAAATGARVTLAVPPNLVALMRTLEGPERVVPDDRPIGSFDRHCSLMDLPGIFGTSPEAVPAEIPYLAADPDGVAVWRERFVEIRTRKVGLCWQGNPANHDDRERSLPLSAMEPLMHVPGITYFALRRDGGAMPAGWPLVAPPIGDMADAAAVLSMLDLVISCDTSFAHLAGALGRPVWVPLAYSPDWRWMLDRDDSPWYPTMRLFRQASAGDWGDVMRRMVDALRARP